MICFGFCVLFFVAEEVFPKLSEYETLQGIKGMPPDLPVFLLGSPETPGLPKIDQRSKGWTGRGWICWRFV